jgi:prepilin signal peptidase PulO-like enzyme (type II secretory pathway)
VTSPAAASDNIARASRSASLTLPTPKALLALLGALLLSGAGVMFTPIPLPVVAPLAFTLCWAVAIDIDRLILPDTLNVAMIIGGLLWFGISQPASLASHVIGAVAGFLSLAILAEAFLRVRGYDGLGGGDAKLLAAAGAWLGWGALPFVVLIASTTGLAVALGLFLLRRQGALGPIAFGPFIAAGFWIMLLLDGYRAV